MTANILESISDGVFTVDGDWRVTFFNKAAERITGIDRTAAIGKLCHEVFKSNMCESECPLRKTMRSGKAIIDKKGYCVNPRGERVPISVSTAILTDADGVVAGGAETFRDLREIEELKERLQAKVVGSVFPSRNPAMRKMVELIPVIAKSSSTVLVHGETGTGKEVLARAIHRASGKREGSFVAVNCGALPDTLLESELFGYKKGAFTGADKDKAGRFKLAENGTLFLDEIGDISPALQVKLLRVLQEREYEPLGSTITEKTNARILCATNRNLKELVEEGRFRQDLFYRVKVIELELSPLRERKEDIPQLADHFLVKYSHQARKHIQGFSPEVFAAFYAYSWPGNIRELENIVERAVVLCGGDMIDRSLLPEEVVSSSIVAVKSVSHRSVAESGDIRQLRQTAERDAILGALEHCDFQCSRAAYELGIDKATLYRKMKTYGISAGKMRKR